MNFRDQALSLVKEHGYRDLCEVGVWRGELSRMLSPLARTLVLVDPWSALWNDFIHRGTRYDCTMGEPLASQLELNGMYDALRADLPGALILRMPSHVAVQHVPECSLDFVFIDSVHTYNHCLSDILKWPEKLRPGGMLAGDDYCGEVKEAVDHVFGKVESKHNVWWKKK